VFEVGQVYAFAQSSRAKLARHRFTALFLLEKEMHSPATVSSVSQPFDGVIDIDRRREGDAIVRKIGVLSLKDTAPDERFHEFLTLAGRGLMIKPMGPARPPTPPPASEPAMPPAPPSNRAAMILRIAEERIRIDPTDADALFAKASALAAMGDTRGAIGALDALATANDTYPGLWVLRAKLFARMGDPGSARESRNKADEIARREEHKARTGDTVPCARGRSPLTRTNARTAAPGSSRRSDSRRNSTPSARPRSRTGSARTCRSNPRPGSPRGAGPRSPRTGSWSPGSPPRRSPRIAAG
jgi:hypothetical protein